MPSQPSVFLVYVEDPDSSSGVSITGIFDNKASADSFAESEGPGYLVEETSFGPIDWNKLNPIPPMPWDEVATAEVKRNLLRPNEGLMF